MSIDVDKFIESHRKKFFNSYKERIKDLTQEANKRFLSLIIFFFAILLFTALGNGETIIKILNQETLDAFLPVLPLLGTIALDFLAAKERKISIKDFTTLIRWRLKIGRIFKKSIDYYEEIYLDFELPPSSPTEVDLIHHNTILKFQKYRAFTKIIANMDVNAKNFEKDLEHNVQKCKELMELEPIDEDFDTKFNAITIP